MKKNILITGGAGFVGSNLAVFLSSKLKDTNIICYDNLIRKGSELNVDRLKDQNIVFVKGDVREKKQLLELPKIDLLLECSAEPSVLASYDDPQYTIDTNLIGTINCLELAKRDKADFIFLSTSRVYPIDATNKIPWEEGTTRFDFKDKEDGFGYGYQGITEDFNLSGVKSLYGATKLASEHLILEYMDMFGLRGVIKTKLS